MERYKWGEKTKINCVNKLKDKNANMLHGFFVQGYKAMQLEINEIYKKLQAKWYDKELSDIENQQINDFLNIMIQKEVIDNEKADKYAKNYKKVKELLENKLKYMQIADMKVMRENFKCVSIQWKPEIFEDKNWVKYKESIKEDVWEYTEWKYKWEQLFTRLSALRETKKQWIRMLMWEEWEKITKKIRLHTKYCGYRINDNIFININKKSYYWIPLDISGDIAMFIEFKDINWDYSWDNKYLGMSVRWVVLD